MSISVALYKLLSKIRGEKPKKNNPGSKSIEHMINEITKEVEEGSGGGDGQALLNKFIAGDMDVVTYEGELVPHRAFQFKRNLEEVYLPNATYIGGEAFAFLSGVSVSAWDPEEQEYFTELNLKKVEAPKVTTIDNGAFVFSKIREFIHGNDLVSIGIHSFTSCEGLTNFEFNEGLLCIGSEAFFQAPLSFVKIPKSVLILGSQAFFCYKDNQIFSLNYADFTDFDINEMETPWPPNVSPDLFGDPNFIPNTFKIYFKNQETLDAYVNNDVLSAYTSFFTVGTPPTPEEEVAAE